MPLKAYKKDQGRHARMAAFWSVVLLLLFGCVALHSTLVERAPAALHQPIGGLTIPILGWEITGAFLISTALLVAGIVVVYSWQQRPQVADLLIETESELKKVTWPTLQEVINSSVVVIVSVVILMAFLAAADWVLGKVVSEQILGLRGG